VHIFISSGRRNIGHKPLDLLDDEPVALRDLCSCSVKAVDGEEELVELPTADPETFPAADVRVDGMDKYGHCGHNRLQR